VARAWQYHAETFVVVPHSPTMPSSLRGTGVVVAERDVGMTLNENTIRQTEVVDCLGSD
jgi:hypothetical protein